jgi:hypothetical protein
MLTELCENSPPRQVPPGLLKRTEIRGHPAQAGQAVEDDQIRPQRRLMKCAEGPGRSDHLMELSSMEEEGKLPVSAGPGAPLCLRGDV